MTVQDRLKNYPRHPSMRGEFGYHLYTLMIDNPDIWIITGDLGYPMFNPHLEDFPNRFINVGAAETSLMNVAVGLALEGKTPIAYSITPFLLYRPFEVWRTYINHEKIPVIGIGSGRDDDYKHDGFSHYAGDDIEFMQHLTNVNSSWPKTSAQMKHNLDVAIKIKEPTYINLTR